MTDENRGDATAPAAPATGPGAMLRAARKAQGLHIAALAASLKVPQAKLEALEQERFDLLPDPTFARALAQSVCRVLKIDAAPVLAQMPRNEAAPGLEHFSAGLGQTYRERGQPESPVLAGVLRRPVTWVLIVLGIGAAAVWFWPALSSMTPAPEPSVTVLPLPAMPASAPDAAQPAASAAAATSAASEPADATAASAPVADPAAVAPRSETVHSAPPVSPQASAAVQGPVELRVTEPSWIEAVDAQGRSLLARTVQPGETLGLDGTMPLRLTVGNAQSTQVLLRGQTVDLAPYTRGNVARLELK